MERVNACGEHLHIVRAGETLRSIAEQAVVDCYGPKANRALVDVTQEEILSNSRLNHKKLPDYLLSAGTKNYPDVLVIPAMKFEN